MMTEKEPTQSTINWHALKKIYLQGAKRTPEPDPAPVQNNPHAAVIAFEKIEEYIKPIIEEIDTFYKGKLEELSEKTYIELEGLRMRIVTLEAEVQRLSEEKIISPRASKEEGSNSYIFNPIESKMLIRIEDSQQEESLLEETAQKLTETQQLLQPRTVPKRKSMGKSSSNCKRLFVDLSTAKEALKHQYSQAIYPLSTMRSSSVFESSTKEMRDELFSLRKFIEMNHNVSIDELPSAEFGEVKASVKEISVTGSKKEVAHLKNENEQLRSQNGRIKEELLGLEEELRSIRGLLCQALQEIPHLKA